MFDLITGKVQHVPSTPSIPIVVSTSIQAIALAAIVLTSMLYATKRLPPVPDVLAFVAEMPAAAPPPPPAAPSQPKPRVVTPQAAPLSAQAAPIEAPKRIEAEPPAAASVEEGVPGGVDGGITGGMVDGLAGTVEGPTAPPPPPVAHEPIRVGGQLKAPALVKRVEPIYPQTAQLAGVEGVVILDAIIDEHGRVQSVRVLRGPALLADAAITAIDQWIYEPLRLNGTPTGFELTVTFNFHADKLKLRV